MSSSNASYLRIVVIYAVTVAGCAIDFDAPFTDSQADASASGGSGQVDGGGSSGTTGGSGATGGTGGGSGGSTGGTGGGTGGTGGNTATGGTGATGNEQCSNGIDDDADGQTDCADTDCAAAGYQCVEIPPGWNGPMGLVMAEEAPLPCVAPWGIEHALGGMDPQVPSGGSCPSCSCDPPDQAQCGLQVLVYDQANCTGDSEPEVFMAIGTCINVGMQAFSPQSVRATSGFAVESGACTPTSSGTESLPPARWGTQVRACRTTVLGGGCNVGGVCSPPVPNGPTCIARASLSPCPPGFPTQLSIYQTLNDSRMCSPCGCGDPTGDCAGSEISVEDPNGGCPGDGEVITTACTEISLHPTYDTFSLESWAAPSPNATCEPSGGAVVGGVMGEDLLTICCTPP